MAKICCSIRSVPKRREAYFCTYKPNTNNMKISRRNLKNLVGHIGEYLVILWLRTQFMTILFRRYRSPVGEIDIVAQKGDTLVFIEVKTSITGTFNDIPISVKQQRSIIRAAKHFLTSHPKFANCEISFEIYCLSLKHGVRIIRNPWDKCD
ncbi:endonuclease YraN-like protein [Anaplasma platys]|uniref:UPF0102 protein ANPL_04340 n=2 Tax=Anaplasma platys TaxID=949 RepID=A0A858PZC8_9RICK|nr:endonuclease YraN-like protein [Anaplasma platys]